MRVKMKNTAGRWEEMDLPVTKEHLESMRVTWKQWLKDHVRPGVESSGPETGAARSVVGIDEMKITGFDKLILGIAVVAKKVVYLED